MMTPPLSIWARPFLVVQVDFSSDTIVWEPRGAYGDRPAIHGLSHRGRRSKIEQNATRPSHTRCQHHEGVLMDPGLIGRAKRGDKEAFTTLVLQFGGRLYSIAYRILRDTGRAEDAVQQVFLTAWRDMRQL